MSSVRAESHLFNGPAPAGNSPKGTQFKTVNQVFTKWIQPAPSKDAIQNNAWTIFPDYLVINNKFVKYRSFKNVAS